MVHGIFNSEWSTSKLRATVYDDTLPAIALWTLISGLIVLIEENIHATQLPAPFLSGTVGTILGLAVALLTGSAMSQYNAGHQGWTQIREITQKFVQGVWFHVASDVHAAATTLPPHDTSDAAAAARQLALQTLLEQRSVIDLASAYATAVKHSLRGEPGAYYADLYPLIQHLPRHAGSSVAFADSDENLMPIWRQSRDLEFVVDDANHTPPALPSLQLGPSISRDSTVTGSTTVDVRYIASSFSANCNAGSYDIESGLPMCNPDRPLSLARLPPSVSVADYVPLLRVLRYITDRVIRTPAAKLRHALSLHKRWVKTTESVIPCEIANYIHAHLESFVARGYFKAGWDGMVASCVNELRSAEARLVHIRNTRLAFAYQAHLRICTWLYLVFFPLTNYNALGKWVILAEALVAFIFLGMLDIARELENPFGYDVNDINQDAICTQIRCRSAQITSHLPGASYAHTFAPTSQPLAPADYRPAPTIIADFGDNGAHLNTSTLQQAMLRGWRMVRRHGEASAGFRTV